MGADNRSVIHQPGFFIDLGITAVTGEYIQRGQNNHDDAAVKYDADAFTEILAYTARQNDGLALDIDGNDSLEYQHTDDTCAITQCCRCRQKAKAEAHNHS